MRLFLLLFALFIAVADCEAQENQFHIKGVIIGECGGPIIFVVGRDTFYSEIKDHTISISGSLQYPTFMTITVPGSKCGSRFLAENSEINLEVQATKSEKNRICTFVSKVTGSRSDSLYRAFNKLRNEIPNGDKNVFYSKLKIVLEEFVKANPGFTYNAAFISQYLLVFGTRWGEDIAASLDPSVHSSPEGKQLQRDIQRIALHEKGSLFPDFTMKQLDGKLFSSVDLRGKYVLYDFWASWCQPCRLENPKLVASYNRYKAKGFEIVGISLDNQPSKWREAVAQDELSWIHISDLNKWQNELAVKFQLSSIPYNILVGPDGKILATDLRPFVLEYKLKEIFGE